MESTLQLLDGDGTFKDRELERFLECVQLKTCGRSYVVVAIMGPQSSGKSTLLNRLFGTRFAEMDALVGRQQTTRGVWLAKAEGLAPFTLVVDVEGTDGAERGEDDTLFERQSALFALVVSDILMINIWNHDIGREKAANWPLIKTIFEVMMRVKWTLRKTTLMFVIRDMSITPIEKLESLLRDNLQAIWKGVRKPPMHKMASMDDFFTVVVVSLPNFEHKRPEFEEQVAELRALRFQNSTAPRGLAGDRNDTVPGESFSLHTKNIWQNIKENKDLDLPAQAVMVATVRCDQIVNEKLQKLKSDEEWLFVEEEAQTRIVSGFGNTANSVIMKYLDEYRADATGYKEEIMESKLNYLISEVWSILQPSYWKQIKHHQVHVEDQFERNLCSENIKSNRDKNLYTNVRQEALDMFDRGCDDAKVALSKWDPSALREELCSNMEVFWQAKRDTGFAEVKSLIQMKLEAVLRERTVNLLAEAGKSSSNSPSATWSGIQRVLNEEVTKAQTQIVAELRGYDPTEEETNGMQKSIAKHGRCAVMKKAKDEATRVLDLMVKRFNEILTHDNDGSPRQWATKIHDIDAICREGKSSSLKLQSSLVSVKLGKEIDSDEDVDGAEHSDGIDIESGCLSYLVVVPETPIFGRIQRYWNGTKRPTEMRDEALLLLSRKSSWHNVSDTNTLITPDQFKTTWKSFEIQTQRPIDRVRKENRAARSDHKKSLAKGAALGVAAVAVTGGAAVVAVV